MRMAKPKLHKAGAVAPDEPAWTRLWRQLFAPVDGASVVFMRIAFGLLMAWEGYRDLVDGIVRGKYAGPPFLIGWPGLEWVQRWPGDGLYWHFYALCLLGLCIATGFCYRAAAALFCVGFTYVLLLTPAWFQNHFYLICLWSLLLAFVPAHGMLSVDARLRPGLRSETIPAWALWILRGQLGVVYFFGGVAKLQGDWLQGYPMRLWLPGKNSIPVLGELFDQVWVAVLMSWSGLLIDLFAFPALLWRRSRPYAFAILVSFHLWNSQLFHIGVFPWMAISLTTLFFPPDWPRRVFNWPRRSPSEPKEFHWTPGRRALAGFLTVYAALQVLLPFRQHLYPGNPSWNSQGHQFAWRMMLRKKNGYLTYQLRDPDTGDTWLVSPNAELDQPQAGRLAVDPNMIHVYAHHLADLARETGHQRIEVRALALASLNGREPEPLIDREVNLVAQKPSLLRSVPGITRVTKPLGDEWRSKYPHPQADSGFDVQ